MIHSDLPKIGLYRHFKGNYYYVTGLSKSATDEKTILVNYFDVCHPEIGSFTRPLEDFIANSDEKGDVKDRKDNITGQTTRFERVKDLNFQIGSISTEQLISELGNRTDSPIHELDIEGLRSPVFSKDYVVGEAYEETENTPRGVYTVSTHDTLNEARRYFESHKKKKNARIFKRVFIDVTDL